MQQQVNLDDAAKLYTGNIQIRDINYKGKTKLEKDILNAYFEPVKQATTLQEATVFLEEAKLKLEELHLFNHIHISLTSPSSVAITGIPSQKLDVNVNLNEKKNWSLAASFFTTTDGKLLPNAVFCLKNPFGRAEELQVQVGADSDFSSKGLQQLFLHPFSAATFNIEYTKPLLLAPDNQSLNVKLHSQVSNNSLHSHYVDNPLGATVSYNYANHQIAYEALWRHVVPTKDASLSVRQSAGHSLKSSIKYKYFTDTRDSKVLPTTGYSFALEQELAGLGGNVRFLKGEVIYQPNVPLGQSGWALNFLARGGYLVPLGGDKSRINDRFPNIGGVTTNTLRGFGYRGAGPRSPTEALGGNYYFCANAHLTAPVKDITFKNGLIIPINFHLFSNWGNVVLPANGSVSSIRGDLASLLSSQTSKLTMGAGLVACIGQALRIELNYAHPILFSSSDKVSKAQVGLIVSY